MVVTSHRNLHIKCLIISPAKTRKPYCTGIPRICSGFLSAPDFFFPTAHPLISALPAGTALYARRNIFPSRQFRHCPCFLKPRKSAYLSNFQSYSPAKHSIVILQPNIPKSFSSQTFQSHSPAKHFHSSHQSFSSQTFPFQPPIPLIPGCSLPSTCLFSTATHTFSNPQTEHPRCSLSSPPCYLLVHPSATVAMSVQLECALRGVF